MAEIEANPRTEGSKVTGSCAIHIRQRRVSTFVSGDDGMSMELSEYYTIEQVAAFFGASRAFIVDAISKGIIKSELFGRKKIVIHKSQIELMKAHRKPNRPKIERPPLKLGEYYDMTQAAKAFGITPSTLYKAIGAGIIKRGSNL